MLVFVTRYILIHADSTILYHSHVFVRKIHVYIQGTARPCYLRDSQKSSSAESPARLAAALTMREMS